MEVNHKSGMTFEAQTRALRIKALLENNKVALECNTNFKTIASMPKKQKCTKIFSSECHLVENIVFSGVHSSI